MAVSFYDIFSALCTDISLSPSKAAEIIGFNKGTVSAWRGGRTKPSNEILLKISNFFNVPYSFLTQTPPFDLWGEILADYSGFLKATGLSDETLTKAWGLDPNIPRAKELVAFISDYIKEIHLSDGKWTIISKTGTGQIPTRNIFKVLESLRDDLEKNNVFFYRDIPLSDEARKRLIWAIQLGLDATDNLVSAEKENKQS
nr:helix-turn-helix transcriptional regulator [uncultured Flavonifractor sp.]